jgi:DNA-binding response OmpR family regulator
VNARLHVAERPAVAACTLPYPDMPRALLIDDHPLDRKILRDALAHVGFAVEEAADGASGLRLLYASRPDIVVLDVLMPVMDGWAVCERVRELSDVPIIMLTSLDREEEMIRGLELGADDFVSKPVSPRHLVARVRALLRRARAADSTTRELFYDDGTLTVNVAAHRVARSGEPIALTPTEFRLLVALVEAPGRVHPYAALLSSVWGPEYVDDVDFLRVYVRRLRKKLEPDPERPRWIVTERGFGYRFAGAAETLATPVRQAQAELPDAR